MKTSELIQNNLASSVYIFMAKEDKIKDFCGVIDPNFSPIIENSQDIWSSRLIFPLSVIDACRVFCTLTLWLPSPSIELPAKNVRDD
jgi:hypothetical protein